MSIAIVMHTENVIYTYTCIYMGFPNNQVGKESTCNAGDSSSIPGSRRSIFRRERLTTPVFWPGEFHGLQSMGLQRVGHDWVNFTSHRYIYIHTAEYYSVFRKRKKVVAICDNMDELGR